MWKARKCALDMHDSPHGYDRHMRLLLWLVRHRRNPIAQQLLYLLGLELPADVRLGNGLRLPHRGRGVVVTRHCVIGDRVSLYPHVVIGRSDAVSYDGSGPAQDAVVIGDDVSILPGAVVCGTPDRPTVIGSGAIIAPNAVVLTSVGAGEKWGGVPARRIG